MAKPWLSQQAEGQIMSKIQIFKVFPINNGIDLVKVSHFLVCHFAFTFSLSGFSLSAFWFLTFYFLVSDFLLFL